MHKTSHLLQTTCKERGSFNKRVKSAVRSSSNRSTNILQAGLLELLLPWQFSCHHIHFSWLLTLLPFNISVTLTLTPLLYVGFYVARTHTHTHTWLWLPAKQTGDNMIKEGKTMNIQAHIDRHPIGSLQHSRREESKDGESWKEKKSAAHMLEKSGVQYSRDGQKQKENRMKTRSKSERKIQAERRKKTVEIKEASAEEPQRWFLHQCEFNYKQVSMV